MKIGLLALSGLRAHDPDLLALGLTLPGVIERGQVIAQLPSLGLLFLAAVTPDGHELQYFEAEGDGREPAEVYQCDLVAMSTFSAQVFEAYAIADRLKAAGVRVAMGGLHVSVCPDEAAEHADQVIVGEGESVWPQVVRWVEDGGGPRLWNARDYRPVDVQALPKPRYDLLRDRPYNRFPVQTTRGCPWRCDFCASNIMLQLPYRKRPPAEVVEEIAWLKQLRGRPFVEFADDNTFVDKNWAQELCRRLAPLEVSWFTETDISVADDEKLLQAMRASGCRQLLIGLESPSQSSLEGVELRSNFKARRAVDYLEAVRRIQQHGITVNGCFVLGLDGHTSEVFEEVLQFALEAPLYDVQITVMTPFPGTPLYDRLLAEGRILQPGRWDLCTLFDVNYQPLGMSVEELRQGVYWLADRLYNDECLQQRRRGYFNRLWDAQKQRKSLL